MIVTLVVNPNSGRGRAAPVAERVRSALEQAGHDVSVERAARTLAIPKGSELIVLVGGDGTVHHVSPLAIAARRPIYQIPMGTENLFARQFGMTRDPAQLVRAIQVGRVVETDAASVARVTESGAGMASARGSLTVVSESSEVPTPGDVVAQGRREPGSEIGVRDPALPTTFLLMLSVGPDASVVHRLAAARTGAIGHWSYVKPIVQECFHPALRPLTVEADGRRVVEGRSGLLVIANSKEYGVRINPAPRASITDGRLDVVFFPAGSAPELVLWAMRSRFGRHTRSRRLVTASAEHVRVTAEGGSVPYQLDGEAGRVVGTGEERIDVRVLSGALRVLLPESAVVAGGAA